MSASLIDLQGEAYIMNVTRDINDRIAQENEIKEMSVRLQTVINKAPFGALSYLAADDGSLIFVSCNSSASEILGFDLEPFIGKKYEEIFPAIDEIDYVSIYRNVAITGQIYELVSNHYQDIRTAGDFDCWAIQTGQKRVTVFFINVTQRKEAERIVLQTTDRLKMSQAIGHVGSWEYDIQTNQIWGSEEGFRIYGLPYHPSGLLDLGLVEACIPEKIKVHQALVDLITKEAEYNLEYEINPADGSDVRALHSIGILIKDEQGNPQKVVGVIQDITERNRILKQLQESEALYRSILNASPDDITVTDLTGKIRIASPMAAQLLNYENGDQFIEHNVLEFLHPEDRETAITNIKKMFDGKVSEPHDYRVVCSDGSFVMTEIKGDFIRDAQENPIGMVFVVRDITQRLKIEQEIKQLNENLEQIVAERTAQLTAANKELEAFSYSVSHDLRAPLRGIDGWSLVLLEDYADKLDDDAKRHLITIRKEAQIMGNLIESLLKLSRINRDEMSWGDVSLSQIASEISGKLLVSQPDRNIVLNIQPDIHTQGDERLLAIALTNLLSNAFKFSSQRRQAVIEFGQTQIDNVAVYYIRDNGVGFDMQYSDKLFGTFQRLHNTAEFSGTGIGLATVKRIINRHGGRIWAESVVNSHAVFYFTLQDGFCG
jgi:PAS domain S-box-containing protein